MHRTVLIRIAAIAVTGTSLLAVPAAAQADEESVLYVRQHSAACADEDGGGTLERPFCTIGAAATAEDGGAKPLTASRTSVGSWEKFTLG